MVDSAQPELMKAPGALQYQGVWIRFVSLLLDTIITGIIFGILNRILSIAPGPYHINGMPAKDALIESPPTLPSLSHNIGALSITNEGNEVQIDSYEIWREHWKEYYKNHTSADWFDPWYWDALNYRMSTHVLWEAKAALTPASISVKGYSHDYNRNMKTFVINIAKNTSDHQTPIAPDTSGAWNQAITNVYTAWRASFSALRQRFQPRKSHKMDPRK